MNLFEQRPLLVLLEAESGIVLGTVPTVACGQMLMLGLLNTQINYFPIQAAHRKTEWDAYDFNSPNQVYAMSKGWKIALAADALVTPRVLERRKLMRLRISYLHPWEIYCKGSLVRFKGYMSDAAQAFIRHELSLGTGSGYVQEYASINEIDLENAVEELGSKVRSLGMIEARNWAQYEKIARAMAMAETREDLEACMQRGFDVLYNNAYV